MEINMAIGLVGLTLYGPLQLYRKISQGDYKIVGCFLKFCSNSLNLSELNEQYEQIINNSPIDE